MVKRVILGFLAGALAVAVFHQCMVLILHLLSFTPNFPWRLTPTGPWGVPTIVNQMFWGGLWGVGFVLVRHLIPVSADVAKGAIYGLLGPFLLGNGILVPFFKSTPYLFGFDPQRMIISGLIALAFGIGIGVFWRLLNSR